MELPVMIQGKQRGTLFLETAKGGDAARVQMEDIGRVARLYIFGGGERQYLGIPEPDGRGGMTLKKRLSSGIKSPEYCGEEEVCSKTASAPASAAHVVWMGGRPYYF